MLAVSASAVSREKVPASASLHGQADGANGRRMCLCTRVQVALRTLELAESALDLAELRLVGLLEDPAALQPFDTRRLEDLGSVHPGIVHAAHDADPSIYLLEHPRLGIARLYIPMPMHTPQKEVSFRHWLDGSAREEAALHARIGRGRTLNSDGYSDISDIRGGVHSCGGEVVVVVRAEK